jgi:hypothetical protein
MPAPKLDDNHIFEMKKVIQDKQLGINRFVFEFKKEKVYVDAFGVEGIPQTEEYYDNIEDHIIYSDLSWFGPLCNELKVNLNASVMVDPEGNFEHSEVQLELHTAIHGDKLKKTQILSGLLPLLKKLIPFRAYMTNVEFGWHDSCLRSIRFGMKLDGKKVNTILKNTQGINTQVLSQWSSTVSTVIDYNNGRFKHQVVLPIVNGRMNTAKFETGLSFKFNGKGRKNDWS